MMKSEADLGEEHEAILAWQAATFPHATARGAWNHLAEEMHELEAALTEGRPKEEIGAEMADAFIMLSQLATCLGIDFPAAVRGKRLITQARMWMPPDENGVVRHLKSMGDA